MDEQEIKSKLTPEQYKVLREKGTEAPFTGKYVHKSADGSYACMVCANPLFSSDAQFDSGTGWPSFDKPIDGSVEYIRQPDKSQGHFDGPVTIPPKADLVGEPDSRTEIICSNCKSHLGHVFDDGPTQTGKRYCINSVCLDLKKKS